MTAPIRTVFWENEAVVMVDQRALPGEERYVRCDDYRRVMAAISDLTVRGAPAIGVAAALGIALGARSFGNSSWEEFRLETLRICDDFARTRPTARNLFWAIERMKRRLATLPPDPARAGDLLLAEALSILEEDIEVNRRIGLHGRTLIDDGDAVLTHCNAGALATAGYGTALGVLRAAREEGKRFVVYVDETRPVLQGARLTAWELAREGIEACLVTDNMAGWLMKLGRVRKVVTGADRVAANGDTANKIGTYSLAVLARHHGIPLYIAAPRSTIDLSLPDGTAIPIEERDAEEVRGFGGLRWAPEGFPCFNPAFDVTPADLVSAIITEDGIVSPPFGENLRRL